MNEKTWIELLELDSNTCKYITVCKHIINIEYNY